MWYHSVAKLLSGKGLVWVHSWRVKNTMKGKPSRGIFTGLIKTYAQSSGTGGILCQLVLPIIHNELVWSDSVLSSHLRSRSQYHSSEANIRSSLPESSSWVVREFLKLTSHYIINKFHVIVSYILNINLVKNN